MNKFLVVFLCLFFLVWGCDTRKDELLSFNSSPFFVDSSLNLADTLFVFTDSVKFVPSFVYSFDVGVIDVNDNLSGVSYNFLEGDGDFSFVEIKNDVFRFDYVFPVNFLSSVEIDVIAQDDFFAVGTLEVNFIVFDNLFPVAVLQVEDDVNNSMVKILDASMSYDGDSKFGGSIVSYEYTFLGRSPRESDSNVQRVIFSRTGRHIVSLRVKDNDGVYSPIVSKTINL